MLESHLTALATWLVRLVGRSLLVSAAVAWLMLALVGTEDGWPAAAVAVGCLVFALQLYAGITSLYFTHSYSAPPNGAFHCLRGSCDGRCYWCR